MPEIRKKQHIKYTDHKGRLHRIDGPARIYDSGTTQWYRNGKKHRTDGPAVEYSNGRKIWYYNDKRHRLDGPAVITAHGSKSWWIDDIKLTKEEYDKQVKLIKRSNTIKKILSK